jgi:hypothetical protein
MRFWIARELKSMLEHCGQPVPQELSDLILEDTAFIRECRMAMTRLLDGKVPTTDVLAEDKAPEDTGEEPADVEIALGGDFDAELGVWILPGSIPSYRRKLLHWLADEIGLPHVSADMPGGVRRLHIATEREVLPDKFFIEGEEVLVQHGHHLLKGIVVDPRVHRRQRTVCLRLEGAREDRHVDVEKVSPVSLNAEMPAEL